MPEGALTLGPREWLAGAEFPWPSVTSLLPGSSVVACYCLLSMQRDFTKAGKLYFKLQLSDRHGTVEARVWDPVPEVMERLVVGAFVGIRGAVEAYNGSRQLKVAEILPVEVRPDDLHLFMPRSPRDADAMERELQEMVRSVRDRALRAVLRRVFAPDSDTGRAFRMAPAAKHNHHAYVGGLLEHSLSVARACDRMAEHYWPAIDRDLLVTGALLHDLGKIREIGAKAGFPYTDEGKLLGHIVIGLQMVADAARGVRGLDPQRLLLLQHLIASHQGKYEWQSPREPLILEALVLHFCDDLDAKMNQALSLVAAVQSGWTAYDRHFGREFLRHFHPAAAAEEDGEEPEAELPTLDLFA